MFTLKDICLLLNDMINNSGLSSNVYVPVDDISVCTYSVYEAPKKIDETSTMITKTYNGTVKLSAMGTSLTYSVKIGLGANGYIYGYANNNMQPTGYTITGNTIVITTTGSVDTPLGTKTFGNWTGTLSNNNKTITFNKSNITGTIASYISGTSFSVNEDTVLIDGSEGTNQIRNVLTRQYNDGSWHDDPGNSDRILQTSDAYIQGSNAIFIRPYTSGNARIIITPSVAQAQSAALTSVSFWYYVPSGYDFTLRLYSYNGYDPVTSSYHQDDEKVYTATSTDTGWHYINCGINSSFNKNFAIFVSTKSPNPYFVDYITYF